MDISLPNNIDEYINNLVETLPKELQTDAMKERLKKHAFELIFSTISDNFSPEDAHDVAVLSEEMDIPFENIMDAYMEDNPHIYDQIGEELNRFAETITEFSK